MAFHSYFLSSQLWKLSPKKRNETENLRRISNSGKVRGFFVHLYWESLEKADTKDAELLNYELVSLCAEPISANNPRKITESLKLRRFSQCTHQNVFYSVLNLYMSTSGQLVSPNGPFWLSGALPSLKKFEPYVGVTNFLSYSYDRIYNIVNIY